MNNPANQLPRLRRYASLHDRILAFVVSDPDPEHVYPRDGTGTACWLWIGQRYPNRSGNDYPMITMRVPGKKNPTRVRVHRLVLSVFKNLLLEKGLVAAHRCNNTMCVNPDHLELVSQSNNMQQSHDEGRAYRPGAAREPGED